MLNQYEKETGKHMLVNYNVAGNYLPFKSNRNDNPNNVPENSLAF